MNGLEKMWEKVGFYSIFIGNNFAQVKMIPTFAPPKNEEEMGGVAETSSLLNCRTGNRVGGSNPPLSAQFGKAVFDRSV